MEIIEFSRELFDAEIQRRAGDRQWACFGTPKGHCCLTSEWPVCLVCLSLHKVKKESSNSLQEKMKCSGVDYLPHESVTFNPSNAADVEALITKFGPEGLFEIARVLETRALQDVSYES